LGTIAGRVGVAWDKTLLFGKAGGAWVNDTYRVIDLASGGTVSAGDETRWGWMVGIGVERAFIDNWSLKIEYDFMGFGKNRVTLTCSPVFCGVPTPVPEDIGQNISVVKAGINYHFGGPIIAKN
jgi:outer membrane immunogenic protein